MNTRSVAIKRLMDEVRNEAGQPHCYDRAHNRHNRSGQSFPVDPLGWEDAPPAPPPKPDEKEADE